MRKLYIINILLIVILFYAGVHFNEEEKAFLAGLRPNGDSYAWAISAYAILGIICTLFAGYVGQQTFYKMRTIGAAMLLLAVIILIYSVVILMYSSGIEMQDVLLIYGPYIVIGMWLNAYSLMMRAAEEEI